MEGNSWRSDPAAVDLSSGDGDWRQQLSPEARQRIVNKIMDTLKRHLPISAPDGLSELKKIAIHFEEKIYAAATNQSDYLRKISLKMLSMETKTQDTAAVNPSLSNPGNPNPSESGSGGPLRSDPAALDGDWRQQLSPEARQRIVNKIMDTLKRHLPISAPEGLSELKKIAIHFEEKIYAAATNQSDYLRKIALKMLSMETKTQDTAAVNPSLSNPVTGNPNPSESVSNMMKLMQEEQLLQQMQIEAQQQLQLQQKQQVVHQSPMRQQLHQQTNQPAFKRKAKKCADSPPKSSNDS